MVLRNHGNASCDLPSKHGMLTLLPAVLIRRRCVLLRRCVLHQSEETGRVTAVAGGGTWAEL